MHTAVESPIVTQPRRTARTGREQNPEGDAQWTTRRLLAWMNEHFSERGIDSPRLIAELLLSHVIGCDRMRLYMEADRPATPDERQRLRGLVARASGHEPVQYLVGEGWFFSRPFEVNRSTLIPRPSTETLVERVLAWCRDVPERSGPSTGDQHATERDEPEAIPAFEHGSGAAAVSMEPLRIADVGTGTGCIATSLAAQLPKAKVLATDVFADVLELAKRNAQRHGVAGQIEFVRGDLLEPVREWVSESKLDVLCSNPPYVPDEQWEAVERNVKEHEPESALRGGANGLDYIRPLIAGAGQVLRSRGLLAVEIANVHRQPVLELVEQSRAFGHAQVVRDHEGHDRVLLAERR